MAELVAHTQSAGVRNPCLDLFQVPDTDLSMSSRRVVKINPFNTGINLVTFEVDPQGDFLNLKESFFEVEVTVKKSNASNLLQGDVMGLANNLAHTLFKQINVRLNGTLISPQTDTYHLKVQLEAIMNYDCDDGDTLLTLQGWYNCLGVPDDGVADQSTANKLDPAHNDYKALPKDLKNLVLGRLQFLGGKRVVWRFKLYLELFQLSKLLVPGIHIQIEMYFNSPAM